MRILETERIGTAFHIDLDREPLSMSAVISQMRDAHRTKDNLRLNTINRRLDNKYQMYRIIRRPNDIPDVDDDVVKIYGNIMYVKADSERKADLLIYAYLNRLSESSEYRCTDYGIGITGRRIPNLDTI